MRQLLPTRQQNRRLCLQFFQDAKPNSRSLANYLEWLALLIDLQNSTVHSALLWTTWHSMEASCSVRVASRLVSGGCLDRTHRR